MNSHEKALQGTSSLLYRNLRDNEIRLLHLHPSRHFEAPIYTVLHTVNLDDGPVYKALSYVWGSPTLTSTISVNGFDFEATTNLVSALRHLRGSRAVKVLWVDAVCINQPDNEERSHQVRQMSSIYRRATEVIAWLGESENNSGDAMRLLRDWGSALAKRDVKDVDDTYRLATSMQYSGEAANFIATLEDPLAERSWKALCDLYNRGYWKRLWVVQEFVLAQKVTLTCGFDRADGNVLFTDVLIDKWMDRDSTAHVMRDLPFCDALKSAPVRMNRYLIHDLVKWKARIRSAKFSDGDFFKLLFDMSFRECADTRDYLFAATGFCTAVSPQIVADYSLDLECATKLFAQGCLTQSRLEMLCFAGIGYRRAWRIHSYIPSWAPNWTPNGRSRGTDYQPSLYYYRHYSAGGNSVNVARVTDANDASTSLIIFGAIIDTIEDVLDGFSDWEKDYDDRWKALLFKEKAKTTYVNGMSILQAYFRTLRADISYSGLNRFNFTEEDEGYTSAVSGGQIVDFLLSHCLSKMTEDQSFELLTGPQSEKAAHPSGIGEFFSNMEKPTSDTWAHWVQAVKEREKGFWRYMPRRHARGHCFFTTSQGYMGTGPPYAMPGDKVCVIQGANVPFLLRPDGDGYLLVGEAFVLGLMDGECDDGYYEIKIH